MNETGAREAPIVPCVGKISVCKIPQGFQELLEAVERERSFRSAPSRNARIFHHPTLGDFELQHEPSCAGAWIFANAPESLPVGVNDAELEDRIIQHLAAAAAMGRTQRIARREGRIRSSAHARPQFVVYSPHPNGFSTGSGGDETEAAVLTENDGSIQDIHPSGQDNNQISSTSSGSLVMPITGRGLSSGDRNSVSRSSLSNQERAGPSEFHSFSDTWKSRFSSVSMKYKESISKGTKELKERLFSRSSTMADIGSEVKREVNAGIATVSRMMERLEARDRNRGVHVDGNNSVSSSVTERINNNRNTPDDTPLNGNSSASFAANSISN
ncbi:hypothetical protein OROMI_002169 [Orobanche minor]